jgi:penicillin-binding protein 1A
MAFSSRTVRVLALVGLFVAAAMAGTASGVIFGFAAEPAEISRLDDYLPNTITRVYGREDSSVGEFASERRLVVSYDDVAPVLREAVVAVEDDAFFEHRGFRPTRMVLALVRDVLSRGVTPGRSTITQQLARNLFRNTIGFSRRPNAIIDTLGWERKIKETLAAVQIEKRYTKEQILTMYLNQIAWGHGAYGAEAASRLYFAKSASDLSLNEAATLAGIIQAPARQSPYADMVVATAHRNLALDRMAEVGYISTEAMEAAKAEPIVTRGQPARPRSVAPYFLEAIRIHLEDRYGSTALYEDGLTVRTGLDLDLQAVANRALDRQIRRIDQLHGYRRPTENVLDDSTTLENYRHARWPRSLLVEDVVPALVMGIDGTTLQVRVGDYLGSIARSGYSWTRQAARDVAAAGDLVAVIVGQVDEEARTFDAALTQVPQVQGAVVAIENGTGQVLALIGGEDFQRSQFNRAIQAQRQVGSLFKPFVVTAAVDRGYTAQSLLDDSPASFDVGPDQPPYEPENYDHEYHGLITLRETIEGSRNVPTIRLMDALGPPAVVEYARNLGISSPLPEFLSVAIGAAEASLIEMVSAYSAFPNQGIRMEPRLVLEVVDREGTTLEQHRPVPREAIRADTAYIVTNLLHGVIQRGTAASARTLDWPLGGKTGTTDDYTDAWFIGFDPDITVGVWIGYDEKRTLGDGQTGTQAALPVWREIMASWIARRRAESPEPPEFLRPSNIVSIETELGEEQFIAGTELSTLVEAARRDAADAPAN